MDKKNGSLPTCGWDMLFSFVENNFCIAFDFQLE
jgi:hypothetical protein